MGRARLPDGERRTEQMVIRVTMRERGDFGELAKIRGVTIAEMLRQYVQRELARAKADAKRRPAEEVAFR
jgi:hypothetical protein